MRLSVSAFVIHGDCVGATAQNRTDTLVYMPMYVGTYSYDETHYAVVIHGATGEVQGERPYGSGVLGRTVDWVASRLEKCVC